MAAPHEDPPGGSGPALIRDRLRYLYAHHHPKGRGPYTDAEVSEALKARGHRISPETLRRLRSDEHNNPTAATLTALAEFFGVSPAFFLDSSQSSADVQVLTRSIEKLSPGAREGIAAIIQNILTMEQAAQTPPNSPTNQHGHTGE
ncbi:helix-turn-helix protein [Micromonospora sp. M71_S20]|uniref:helix-turn-helix domain-containing protein n=1 Tax=Micromonospora sp. M71_S20 TaxID=592872 RepID=UPI000EAC340F|nr:helix-turn-helix protein [Micromonospora sp. M71_S20]